MHEVPEARQIRCAKGRADQAETVGMVILPGLGFEPALGGRRDQVRQIGRAQGLQKVISRRVQGLDQVLSIGAMKSVKKARNSLLAYISNRAPMYSGTLCSEKSSVKVARHRHSRVSSGAFAMPA